MAGEWYVRRSKSEKGPFTSQQLKSFAGNGKLLPTDAVRKGDSQKWSRAEKIKGLFPEPAEPEFLDEDEFAEDYDTDDYGADDYGADDYGEDDYGEEPVAAAPPARRKKPSGSRAAGPPSRKKSSKAPKRKRRDADDEDEDEDDENPIWNLLWGAGFLIASVVSFFYFQWQENKGDPEDLDMPGFIQFIYDYTGKWGVSVLAILVGLFFIITTLNDMKARKKKRG